MAKSYEEILKELQEKYKNTTYIPVEDRISLPKKNTNSSNNSHINSFNNNQNILPLPIARKNYETAQSTLTNSIKNQGIEVARGTGLPSYKTIQDNATHDFGLKKDYSALSRMDPTGEKDKENFKKYSEYQKTGEFKTQFENVQKAKDDLGYATYEENRKKIDNKEMNFLDKTVGRFVNGTLNFTDVGPKVRDGKGNYIELPSYQDLYEEKVRNSYDDSLLGKVGQVTGDALFQIGRMATSSAINTFAPGVGSLEYFGSMYRDNYQQAINDGEDPSKALTYATISTATELATEKILGGTTKALTGGSASALNQGIANGLGKILNNKTAINLLSHAGAEATEEFVQEYIDAFTRNVIFKEENSIFDPDLFGNAMYSAVVGGLSGGFGAIGDNSLDIKNKTDRKIMEENKQMRLNNFRDSAKILDSSEQSQNLRNTIEKVIEDKGYNVTFDHNLTNQNGNQVNALINTNQNGEVDIRLNPNSPRVGEFLLVHEITHAIETDSVKNLVLDYASEDSSFNESLENLKKTYGTDDVSSEVLADISGQLFGNQEFINSLSMKEPNIFKKIYDKIIEIANKITGNSNEALFMKELKAKWETAYRTQNNNLNGIEYSVQLDNNIIPYTQHEIDNYNNGKVKIVKSNEDVAKFVEASTKVPSNAKLYFGKIGSSVSNKIKSELGVDVDNYNISLQTSAIKHILKNHGDPKYESNRGQVAITNEDFKLIPLIVSEYDNVSKSGKVENNNQALLFEKQIGDNYYLVNYISDKNHNLEVKTMYKVKANKKNSATASDALMPRSETSETDSGTSSFYDNTLSQNNDKVKLPTKYSMQESKNNSQELENSSFSLKEKQNEIIQKYNPVDDTNSQHTWIRSAEDIKTFEETLQDSDYKEYFEAGEDFDETYTASMAQEALDTGKIMVYSSYPIEQGIFVSPSRMEAESYAGNGRVYSKEVALTDIAWIDPTQGQYAKVDSKYSQNSDKWQEHLEKNYKATGTRTNLQDILLPTQKDIQKNQVKPPIKEDSKANEAKMSKNKIMNPLEISNIKPEAANTTPKLPQVNRNKINDGESKYWNNILEKTDMLNNEQKNRILQEDEVKYYDKVTNKESLNKAFERLNKDGSVESTRWFNKDSNNANSTDVAEGWILLKQYADSNDYDSMVEVAKKMREIGSKAGQTVQAFNIMERMTPEGMVKYAQSELTEAYNQMIKNKSKEWIDEHRKDFDLKPNEVQFIMDNMKEISTMEDGYDKRVKLAEIQKLMTDKLPPQKGSGIKSWMRISMLFNPKTQVRNVVGNALIMPINNFGDLFSSYADKLISKKTGLRTTGIPNVKAMLKGMKEGAYESTKDYRKGINTKDMEGNRFEIGEAKSFDDKKLIGRNLNRVEGLLNYVMDAGDRVFSQSAFENSLQNQMVLNKTKEITQDMIDIARTESLQRTWNDNNNYTKFVLDIRRMLNRIGTERYGLGDILIPFAKTPANITKAIVDYSPVGLVNTIIQGNNLRKSLTNGQYTPQMQHKFVQSLGKATAGTMLYVLGVGLAKAGITSGESDDDKDTANFLKNALGISSYSIKFGNKTFTYDWAQPLAAPLSITANIVNSKNKETALFESVLGNLDTAGSILLEQSFLTSLNEVLNDNDGLVSGLVNQMLNLPARAVPTLSKQIADMVDGTQRTTFEYGKPVQSAINSIKAKIPVLSKTLAPSVDTMGREIQKYGGKNDVFNVMLNPSNVNTENISSSAEEIYRLYKQTGDANIMPKVASYYINQKGEKIIFSSKERASYQKASGKIIEASVNELLKNSQYKQMNDEKKAEIIKDIINYSNNIAQKEILGLEVSKTYEKAYEYSKIGKISDYYNFKNSIDNSDKDSKKESITKYLVNSNLKDNQISFLYGNYYSSEEKLDNVLKMEISMKEFIKFDSQEFESDYNEKGTAIKNSKLNKIASYVNNLDLTIPQKAILIKSKVNSFKTYDNQIGNYVNKINISKYQKASLLKELSFKAYDDYLISEVFKKYSTIEDREKEFKKLGFKIRNGRVYK